MNPIWIFLAGGAAGILSLLVVVAVIATFDDWRSRRAHEKRIREKFRHPVNLFDGEK